MGKKIPNLFLLVERRGEGETRNIRILEAPTEVLPNDLKDFFAPCISEEGYPEGEKFGGCPQPLQAILREVFGQTLASAQNEGKVALFTGQVTQ